MATRRRCPRWVVARQRSTKSKKNNLDLFQLRLGSNCFILALSSNNRYSSISCIVRSISTSDSKCIHMHFNDLALLRSWGSWTFFRLRFLSLWRQRKCRVWAGSLGTRTLDCALSRILDRLISSPPPLHFPPPKIRFRQRPGLVSQMKLPLS